jgi:phage FluMu protein Com
MPNQKKSLYLHQYKEIRCPCCNRELAKASEDASGTLFIYCRKCKKSFTVPIEGFATFASK